MANAPDIAAPLAPSAGNAAHAPHRHSARLASRPGDVAELWRKFEAHPEVTFHQSRAWVDAWTRGTSASLSIITLETDGRPFAILPLEIVEKSGLRIARFAGTAYSNENTGLIDIAPGVRIVLPQRIALRRSFWLIRHADDRRSRRLTRLAEMLSQGLRAEVARLEARLPADRDRRA